MADPGFVFENRSLVKCGLIIDEFGPWSLFQELLAALDAIARRHGVSIPTVAARWVLDRPQVAAVITGARYARHLPQTREVFSLRASTPRTLCACRPCSIARGSPGCPVYGLEGDRKGRHGRIMKYDLGGAGRTAS